MSCPPPISFCLPLCLFAANHQISLKEASWFLYKDGTATLWTVPPIVLVAAPWRLQIQYHIPQICYFSHFVCRLYPRKVPLRLYRRHNMSSSGEALKDSAECRSTVFQKSSEPSTVAQNSRSRPEWGFAKLKNSTYIENLKKIEFNNILCKSVQL